MKRKPSSVKLIVISTLLVFSLVVGNVAYLLFTGKHLLSGQNIRAYSNNQSSVKKVETLYADRGRILDYNGEILANDVYLYKIYAILDPNRPSIEGHPAYVKDKQDTANKLAPLLKTTPEVLMNFLNLPNYQVEFGVHGSNIDQMTMEQIDDLNLPGIEKERITSRYYRSGEMASYLVGFAQVDNETHETIGKMGIEYTHNAQLKGVNGYREFYADTRGYMLPNSSVKEILPQNGYDVYLTIHSDIQRILEVGLDSLEESLHPEKMFAIIMDAKTGRILAISNRPSFNANVKEINDYLDKTVNFQFEPGSVMKAFTYAAALEEGVYPYDQVYQTGSIPVYDQYITDFSSVQKAGTIGFDEGFIRSSNVAIAKILMEHLSPDVFETYLDRLGFFKPTGVEVPQEASGYKNYTYLIDKLNTGFGQASSVTAIQLAQAFSVFANNGRTVKPHLVDRIIDPQTNEVVYKSEIEYSEPIYSQSTIDKMNHLMQEVIYSEIGSGQHYRMDDIRIMGKTGTAEIALETGGYEKGILNTISSVAALVPADDPQFVFYLGVYKPKREIYLPMGSVFKNVVRNTVSQMHMKKTDNNINLSVHDITLPTLLNQGRQFVENKLNSIGAKHQFFGYGNTILMQSPDPNQTISSVDRVFLLTDGWDHAIPDMHGWSFKDVQRLCALLGIQASFEGNGFVVSQSIEAGTLYDSTQTLHFVLQ